MLVVLCPAILSSDIASDPGRRDLLRARRRLCGSECCSSNSNAPDTSQKGLIGIQSHHSREKMAKKAREKTEEAGSASVSPYGSVLGYELVTSQPSRPITVVWPEYRTWFIGPYNTGVHSCFIRHRRRVSSVSLRLDWRTTDSDWHKTIRTLVPRGYSSWPITTLWIVF